MRKLRFLALPGFILLFFLILTGLFVQGTLPNPVLYLRVDLATLAMLVGLCLLVLITASSALWKWWEWAHDLAQTRAADDRRRFLHRLDHELKNPLTAIQAGLANLAEISDGVEAQRETLSSVETQTLRLSRLAADLRKLAELETHALECTSVSVADLLHDVVGSAQEQPEAEGRQLHLILPQAPWPLPHISGDPDLLFLALYNLLDNAFKFSRPRDTIEVRASEDGARVVIEVADTGPGILETEILHVWDELYRGQASRSVPGSGLGLALVRAIISRHGGQVSLRSRVGQGTVVTIRLPVE